LGTRCLGTRSRRGRWEACCPGDSPSGRIREPALRRPWELDSQLARWARFQARRRLSSTGQCCRDGSRFPARWAASCRRMEQPGFRQLEPPNCHPMCQLTDNRPVAIPTRATRRFRPRRYSRTRSLRSRRARPGCSRHPWSLDSRPSPSFAGNYPVAVASPDSRPRSGRPSSERRNSNSACRSSTHRNWARQLLANRSWASWLSAGHTRMLQFQALVPQAVVLCCTGPCDSRARSKLVACRSLGRWRHSPSSSRGRPNLDSWKWGPRYRDSRRKRSLRPWSPTATAGAEC
jgi:hypothetical protein